MYRVISLFCFFLLSTLVQAQEQVFTFKGQVIDSDKGIGVAFATVQVVNKKKGVGTNETGYFEFPASVGDEIKVSSIGYHPQLFIITEDHKENEETILIRLLPKTYELDSVEVIQMRDNFYLIKPIWDTLKIDNPYLTDNPRNWDNINTLPNTNGLAGVTITGFLNGFDKDLQQKKYLQRFKEEDKFRAERKTELEKRFNKKLVKEITDIDDRVLDEFMKFCDFRDGEILRASPYEMTVMILNKYEQFLIR